MIPVPIPEELVPEGEQRQVIAGPSGDLTGDVRPLEAILGLVLVEDRAHPSIRMRIELEKGDLERLQEDPHFWLRVISDHLHPFVLEFTPRCRVCSCTDEKPCVDLAAGGTPCAWVEDDLCSRCASASGGLVMP